MYLEWDQGDAGAPIGTSYENRKNVVQLLSADMLAWVSGKIRAAEVYRPGPLSAEAYQIGMVFLRDNSAIKFGHLPASALANFEHDVLAGMKNEKDKQSGVSDIRPDNDEASPPHSEIKQKLGQ